MNKRFRKEVISILGVSLLLSSAVYCQASGKVNLETQTQAQVEEIFQIETQGELNDYLNKLEVENFLAVLDETSSRLEEAGNTIELAVFNDTFNENIKDELSSDDYIEMVKDTSLSDTMRCYMIEGYFNSQVVNRRSAENAMNGVLREIFMDDNSGSTLRVQALAYIEDINTQDIDSLEAIINGESTDSTLTCKALHTLAKVDEDKTVLNAQDILADFDNRTVKEIAAASKLLVRNGGDLSVIENVIKQADDISVLKMCLLALGESKDVRAIQIFLENIDKYEDDSIVEYFIDKEYQTINELLKSDNVNEVELALECVQLAPFQEFVEGIATISEDTMSDKATMLINTFTTAQGLDDEMYTRNSKWDSSKKY